MKNKEITLVFTCLLILILSACESPWKQPIGEFEIVYYVNGNLGFIMSNGENNHILDFGKMLRIPAWSTDGKILFGLSGYPSDFPAYWDLEKGTYKVCKRNLSRIFQVESSGNIENPYEVIMSDGKSIQMYDLVNCEIVETLVDFNQTGAYIAGISISPITQELVFGLEIHSSGNIQYKIMISDEDYVNLSELAYGINPTWSPDGLMIAYTGMDGLSIMSVDRSFNRRIIDEQLLVGGALRAMLLLDPIPRWSPTGEWIVYHFSEENPPFDDKTDIYIVNVSSGQVKKILTGGINPTWRPIAP